MDIRKDAEILTYIFLVAANDTMSLAAGCFTKYSFVPTEWQKWWEMA